MMESGKSRFWVVAAVLAGATFSLASGQKVADWSYTYTDDFQISKVDNDSFFHSIIWPQGAFPPSEPFLYYKDTGELGFGDFHNQPAQLSYCFPFSAKPDRTIRGQIQLDVRFPYTNAGSLQYSLSADGIVWSNAKPLVAGTNIIPVESIRGICYITFYGIEVFIDNLQVVLNSYPADYFVEQNASSPKYTTIQSAINAASDGDVIEVAPGTYKGAGNTDIDFKGKAITVYSQSGPEVTIIDCENKNRGFYFHSVEEPNSVLRGFTIRNGKKTGSDLPSETSGWRQSSAYPIGAGIYCEFSDPSIIDCVIQQCSTELGGGIGLIGAAPMIADCIIENCTAGGLGNAGSGGYGAGIALKRSSNATFINSVIRNNSAFFDSKGAGLYCYQSRVLLSNCEIRSNSASLSVTGGGIYAAGPHTSVQVQRCLIADNSAQSGAGIFADSITIDSVPGDGALNPEPILIVCNVRITNCTIVNNRLVLPQDVIGGGVHSIKSDTVIRNSIIWANQGQNVWIDDSVYTGLIFYSDIQGGYEGQGNMDVDPLFASPLTGDYHLKSIYGRYNPDTATFVSDNAQSPCIDAGDPQDQVGPEPYPNGKRINMGAYGRTTRASMNISPRIFHVTETGSNGNSGLSREDAFATIQKAVDTADVEGDIIMIWPGVYTEDVKLWGTTPRRLTIQSADDAAEVRGGPEGIAFSFYSGQYSGCVLRNLIITNCNWNAIYCENASPTLTNLTIVNNNFGINIVGSANPNIKRCIFANNDYGDIEQTYMKNVFISRLDEVRQIDSEQGNIDGDPGFFNPSAADGDYHLKSPYGRFSPVTGIWVTTDQYLSPCIDIYYPQDPSLTDPEREPQPNGGLINMGAHGGTPYASKSGYAVLP
jgi:parallel beta-helix repeat protein